MIRAAVPADAEAIARLYDHYVLNTVITFEEEPVSAPAIETRMREVQHGLPWLVLEQGGDLPGYACAGKWKGRSAYRYSVESSIYLAPGHGGKGHGSRLYAGLFAELRSAGAHAVIGGIVLPNVAKHCVA